MGLVMVVVNGAVAAGAGNGSWLRVLVSLPGRCGGNEMTVMAPSGYLVR